MMNQQQGQQQMYQGEKNFEMIQNQQMKQGGMVMNNDHQMNNGLQIQNQQMQQGGMMMMPVGKHITYYYFINDRS